MKRRDLTGEKFNRWTALEYAGDRGWKCICECGAVKIVQTGNLTRGTSKQCRDCGPRISVVNRLPEGEAAFNAVYEVYRKNAAIRGLEWNLSKPEALFLFKQLCFYCGSEPSTIKGRTGYLNGVFVYNGIDRMDSVEGYNKANCVSCCTMCNYMKTDYTFEEFHSQVLKIAKYLGEL